MAPRSVPAATPPPGKAMAAATSSLNGVSAWIRSRSGRVGCVTASAPRKLLAGPIAGEADADQFAPARMDAEERDPDAVAPDELLGLDLHAPAIVNVAELSLNDHHLPSSSAAIAGSAKQRMSGRPVRL